MRRAFVALMGLMMIGGSFAAIFGAVVGAGDTGSPTPALYPAFRIDDDGDFNAHAASGNGGNMNPWIIEDLVVDGTGLGYGIYIGNTTDHFIIRNCTVSGASGMGSSPFYADAGLIFYNVTKGNVDNCTFHNNSGSGILIHTNVRNMTVNGTVLADNMDGLETWDTKNTQITNITASGNTRYGMIFRESQNNNVTNSSFLGNLDGMYLYSSNGFLVEENVANGNSGNGFTLNASNNNDLVNNTAKLNGQSGIHLNHDVTNGSTNNVINWNNVNNNSANGIYLNGTVGLTVPVQWNSILGNNISDNGCGVFILAAENNTATDNWIFSNNMGVALNGAVNISVFHNYFISNSGQADDDGDNIWDDGYPSGGNYWNDYPGVDVMSGPLQDQPGSDDIGDVPYAFDLDSEDRYPLWAAPAVESVYIVDGPNGTGSLAQAYEYAPPWFNITLWAAGYNDALGYVRDLWVNWTNVNYSGAQSNITNITGYSTTWQAGPSDGVALLTANYTTGMTRDVNITIGTFIPDLMIDGKTDNAYENPPVTQISMKNMTRGGSAAYSVVAENDGSSTGTMTLVWDTSGLPASWYAAMLNEDTGMDVTGAINSGTLSFNLNPGSKMNFTLLINSSLTAGFGQTGSVGLGLFAGGAQDSAGAIAHINDPDYIILTDSPGGAPLTTVSLKVDQSVTAYASAYNASGPTYIGLMSVDWTDNPDLGTFDNATGTSSTFTAVTAGAGTITGAGTGMSDTFGVIVTAAPDSHAVVQDGPGVNGYWFNSSPVNVTAVATDNDGFVVNVTLWFRHSPDNTTWENWTMFSSDLAAPWEWDFDVPNGTGYYEFFTVAVDNSTNIEPAPAVADDSCAYDPVRPEIKDDSLFIATTGDVFTVTATVTDNMALHGAHLIYSFGTGTEYNVTMTGAGNTKTYPVNVPLTSLEVLHYRIAAVDRAVNWNSTAVRTVLVVDNDPPIADAGDNQTVETGDLVTLNGTASWDNTGIVNYSWNFQHEGATVWLWDGLPTFTFLETGVYEVTLTVTDAADLNDTDKVWITVGQGNLAPAADAGDDITTTIGAEVTFDGTGSTDDSGIANYTWTFTHNGTSVTLWGSAPSFIFWSAGTYDVTLTVTDLEGLTDDDSLTVTVSEDINGGADNDYLCWILAIIGIIVGLLVLLLLLKRRKKEEESKEEEVVFVPVTEPAAKDDVMGMKHGENTGQNQPEDGNQPE